MGSKCTESPNTYFHHISTTLHPEGKEFPGGTHRLISAQSRQALVTRRNACMRGTSCKLWRTNGGDIIQLSAELIILKSKCYFSALTPPPCELLSFIRFLKSTSCKKKKNSIHINPKMFLHLTHSPIHVTTFHQKVAVWIVSSKAPIAQQGQMPTHKTTLQTSEVYLYAKHSLEIQV